MPVVDVERSVPSDAGARAAAAALACVARAGVAKLTVDDVAREAGVSRATVYRAFPSKQALLGAAVAREADRVLAAVAAAASVATDLDDAVTRIITVGAGALRASAALAFVVAHEPATLAPHLEFAGGDRLHAEVARRLTPVLAPWCDEPARAGEWIARFGLTLLCSSEPLVDPTDAIAVRRVVSTFVTPGLRVPKEA